MKNWKTVTVTKRSMPRENGSAAGNWSPFHLVFQKIGKATVIHLTLHVGLGTFRPVENVDEHGCTQEVLHLSQDAAGTLQ